MKQKKNLNKKKKTTLIVGDMSTLLSLGSLYKNWRGYQQDYGRFGQLCQFDLTEISAALYPTQYI